MEKILKIVFCICCLFPIILKADMCSDLKSDAAKVTASYKFMYKEGLPTFKITLNNMTKNIAIVTPDDSECKDNCVIYAEAVLSSYNVDIRIYDYNYTCKTPVRTLNIKLPQYNQYSNMDICKDIKKYKYCAEIFTEDTDVVEIHEKIINYKKALIKEDKIDVKEEELNEQFKLSDDSKIYNIDKKNKEKLEKKAKEEHVKDNKLTFILGGIVLTLFIIVIIMLLIYKKKLKNKVVQL